MDLYRAAERAMGMSGAVWARHANPWSVYSRILGGSAVFLALYSAHWIGWWAVAPVLASGLWAWLNPRLFPPPKRADGWAARGVLGERAFLNRRRVPLPARDAWEAHGWTALATLCMGPALYGLIVGEFWLACGAWHAATAAKLIFVHRLGQVWDRVKDAHPTYAAWARADWDAGL